MSEKIYIDIEDLKERIVVLERAIGEFQPYSKRFLTETKNSFDEMNSDFTSEIQRVLSSMRDTKAPKLLKKLNSYAELAQAVVVELETTDKELGDMIEGNGKG